MENKNEKLIKTIRERIQFLMTVEIFFSTFLYTFQKVVGDNEGTANTNLLFWGIGVGFCILNFLSIGILKTAKEKILKTIYYFININLLSFAIVCFLLVTVIKKELPAYYKWIFLASFNGMIWIPVATFVFIIVMFGWEKYKEEGIINDIKKSFKKLFKK